MSNFWRSLVLPLINCEIELDWKWSRNCLIPEISRTAAVAATPLNETRPATETTSGRFLKNSAKLYNLVATL